MPHMPDLPPPDQEALQPDSSSTSAASTINDESQTQTDRLGSRTEGITSLTTAPQDREAGSASGNETPSSTARTVSVTEAQETNPTSVEGYELRTAQIPRMKMLPEQEDQEDAELPWTVDFRHDSRSNNADED